MNETGRHTDTTATPVVMERMWSDSDVEEQVQGCVAAWNQSEKPKGFDSPLVGLGILVFLCIPLVG